uniref:DUF220 domain-containing protein n=2 Tax=Opuntia streptacantha TaxID=393608 RepID=A0A7C9DKN6_OPUST
MGETKVGIKNQAFNVRNKHHKMIDPALKFLTQAPQKLQGFLKSNLRRFKKGDEGKDFQLPILRKGLKSSTNWKATLEKQLQLWRENPHWGDAQTPEINVSIPKGSLCNLCVKFDVGLPPDALYNIVTDPNSPRVFKNIEEVISRKVLVDEGSRQVIELEQAATWRFLLWSGSITIHVLIDQNREDHSMKFRQLKPGIMKRFEGFWRLEPIYVDEKICMPFKPKTLSDYEMCTGGKGRIGSRVILEQLLQPAIVPPPPLSWYLRGITAQTTETLLNYLFEEVDRIKGVSQVQNSSQDQKPAKEVRNERNIDEIYDIKQRWALRRRQSILHRKR